MKFKGLTKTFVFLTSKTPILALFVTIFILISIYLLAQNTYIYEYSDYKGKLHFVSNNEITIELNKKECFYSIPIADEIIWYYSSYSKNYTSKLALVTDYACFYQVNIQDFKHEFIVDDSISDYEVKIMYKKGKISLLEKVLKNEI